MSFVSSVEMIGKTVTVRFDDASCVRLRSIDLERHPLAPADEIDVKAYLQTVYEEQRSDAMEAALRVLDRSARSTKALSRKLSEHGYLETVVTDTMDRLCELRLLDDRALAERVIEAGTRSDTGAYAIRRKLLAKGVPEEVFAPLLEALDEQDQTEAALRTLRKYAEKKPSLSERDLRAKAGAYLARHGFSWDSINAAFERYFEEA